MKLVLLGFLLKLKFDLVLALLLLDHLIKRIHQIQNHFGEFLPLENAVTVPLSLLIIASRKLIEEIDEPSVAEARGWQFIRILEDVRVLNAHSQQCTQIQSARIVELTLVFVQRLQQGGRQVVLDC